MSLESEEQNLQVRARLLQIFAALEAAGTTPVSNRDLHAIAYLANVLSPLWDVEPLETSILKDQDGPRSSALQREVDVCVGLGLLVVDSISPNPDDPNKLDATYHLNAHRARPVLSDINSFPDEAVVASFLNDLAFAMGEIDPDRRDDAALKDASWSNPSIATGRIIDFGEHYTRLTSNPSVGAAEAFQRFAPEDVRLNRAEQLLMYVRLLKRRAHG